MDERTKGSKMIAKNERLSEPVLGKPVKCC